MIPKHVICLCVWPLERSETSVSKSLSQNNDKCVSNNVNYWAFGLKLSMLTKEDNLRNIYSGFIFKMKINDKNIFFSIKLFWKFCTSKLKILIIWDTHLVILPLYGNFHANWYMTDRSTWSQHTSTGNRRLKMMTSFKQYFLKNRLIFFDEILAKYGLIHFRQVLKIWGGWAAPNRRYGAVKKWLRLRSRGHP